MPADDGENRLTIREEVPRLEQELGMGLYLTSTPGIGGTLRTQAEDFEVREDSAPVAKAQASGKYTLARVQARNWETNHLVKEIARRLGISRRSVYFTGTKDKRAVTVQNMAIAAGEAQVHALDLPRTEILETYRVDRAPKLGEHKGNSFKIRVRDFDHDEETIKDRAEEIQSKILDQGGFLNYFGPQRFGSVRPITHLVGRELVQGNLEEAVWTYIAYPSQFDSSNLNIAREELWKTRDVEEAIQAIPRRFDYEHDLLSHLEETPGDFGGALTELPLNLTRMFVSAYQSWLFNQATTERTRRAHPKVAEEGDVLHPSDEDGLPDDSRTVPVTERNLERCKTATSQGKGFPTGILPGYDVSKASGLQGRIEKRILDEQPVREDQFRVMDLPKLSRDGTRRSMWCPLDYLDVDFGEDQFGFFVELEFFLPKGSYATCLLREFMKTDPLDY